MEWTIQHGTHALDSKIIAGVDARVIDWRTGHMLWEFIVEQCKVDVDAALAGRSHSQSFDQPGADCYFDTLAVSAPDYLKTKVGDIVTPPGHLGDHVYKTLGQHAYDQMNGIS